MTEKPLEATTHEKIKTREERAREKIKQGKAELRRIAQENSQEKRRNETRTKIILGGLILQNPTTPMTLTQLIAIASERDRIFLASVGVKPRGVFV